jgi:hypothetical protein
VNRAPLKNKPIILLLHQPIWDQQTISMKIIRVQNNDDDDYDNDDNDDNNNNINNNVGKIAPTLKSIYIYIYIYIYISVV